MFSKEDLEYLKQHDDYTIVQANHHDLTLHSLTSSHDWSIVTNYESPSCYILHRHSGRDPYQRQQGQYKSLKDALAYIKRHDKWYSS
jgi:hypothetical protein